MREQAWALEVKPDNFNAIMSEVAKSFDQPFLERWLEESGEGYFIRDNRMPALDCTLATSESFSALYKFASPPVCADKECSGAHYRAIDKL